MQWTLRTRLEEAEKARRLAAGLIADVPGDPGSDDDVIDLTDSRQRVREVVVLRMSPSIDERTTIPDEQHPPAPGPNDDIVGLPVWRRPLPLARRRPNTLRIPSSSGTDASGTKTTSTLTTTPTKDRCPQCKGTVRLVRFDLVRAVAELHCLDCGLQYTAKSPKL